MIKIDKDYSLMPAGKFNYRITHPNCDCAIYVVDRRKDFELETHMWTLCGNVACLDSIPIKVSQKMFFIIDSLHNP